MIGYLVSYVIGVAMWIGIALHFKTTFATVVAMITIAIYTAYTIYCVYKRILANKHPRGDE